MNKLKIYFHLGAIASIILLMSGEVGCNKGPCETCTAYDYISYTEVSEDICSQSEKDRFYRNHPNTRYEITGCQ